jgi:hypothetical protein
MLLATAYHGKVSGRMAKMGLVEGFTKETSHQRQNYLSTSNDEISV